MKVFSFLALVFILALTSCNNTPQENEETVLTLPDADTTFASSNDFAASYEGSIDSTYDISMQLVKTGNMISGSYSYKNKGIAIELNGTIDANGKIEMSELSKGDITGVFTGEVINGTFSGKWSKPDGSKSMPFVAKLINIASMATKTDVLSNAMGQYYLSSISGNVGANTMFDTYMENGKWKSESSSNIGGDREGGDVGLNQKDRDMLNNMHIVVDDKMGIHFYAGLIELFHSPFKASGMDYRVKQKEKSKMNEKMAALFPDSIKINNAYVLLADDKVSYKEILNSGHFDIVTEDNMILTYLPGSNTFELEIFWGECCDSNVLTFEKR